MNRLINLCLAAAGLFLGCGPQSPLLTGTSEQGNAKFTAALYTQAGAPAAGCRVLLRRGDYVTDAVAAQRKTAIESTQTTTDQKGMVRIDSLDTGAYAVEVTDAKSAAALLRFTIDSTGNPVSWGPDTIRPFAAVRGLLDTAGPGVKRFAQVFGLERLVPVASSGAFVIDSLPQGTYKIRIIAADPGRQPVIFDSVSVKAGATTDISRFRAWKQRASIRLNTTSTGAAVTENVSGFPLLIRLTSAHFVFSEALSGGKDLRFSKSDETPLPFEIERWDPDAGLAEVWVRTDTIFGNDSNQSLLMYWGNPAAALPEHARVFDTADGFLGVWHLSDESDTAHDESGNRYHGLRRGGLKRSSGSIGYGQAFDTGLAYCEMGNVPNPGMNGFTASAWVKRSRTGLQTIFAKSTGGTPHPDYGWTMSFGADNQLQCFIATGEAGWSESGAFVFFSGNGAVVDTTAWHFVVATVDRGNAGNCRTYIDGLDVTEACKGDFGSVGIVSNSLPLRIGAEADGDYEWTGSMDECVISRAVRPAAWIRLCYINQGSHDKLVRFR